jgi:hypothetical protein
MAIPVHIDHAIPEETGIRTTAYHQTIGLCYCGDSIVGHLIKETVYEILQRLQHVPIFGSVLSFETICELVSSIISKTADGMRKGLKWKEPSLDLLLGGYCPDRQRIVVFMLNLVNTGKAYEVYSYEVLKGDNEHIAIGSGKAAADRVIARKKIGAGDGMLGVLRNVCNNRRVPSVGGFLQFGHWVKRNFTIVGVQDYWVDKHGWPNPMFTFRGTELFSNRPMLGDGSLYVTGTFIEPFKHEIQTHMDAVIGKVNKA